MTGQPTPPIRSNEGHGVARYKAIVISIVSELWGLGCLGRTGWINGDRINGIFQLVVNGVEAGVVIH